MAFGTSSSNISRRTGYAGPIGAALVLIAIISMVWAGLDTTTDIRYWAVLSFELFGGLIFSSLYGFDFRGHANLMSGRNLTAESKALLIGLFFGAMVLLTEGLFSVIGMLGSTNEGAWLGFLAPAAETMFAVISVYELMTAAFPGMHWIWKAVASDLVFALFHFWHYALRPDWLVLVIVLAIGNTFFVWTYHVTRNATAPMVAHLLVNIAPNLGTVAIFFLVYGPMFILIFIVFFLLFTFLGGRHK